MLRRLAAAMGAALAAIVVPASVATADTEFTYAPEEYTVTVCAATVTVGVPCAVTETGPVGNESFTLSIPGVPDEDIDVAGVSTAATVNGAAEHSVTFDEPGTYTLTVTDAEGQVVGTGQVTAVLAGDDDGDVVGGVGGVGDGDGGLVATGPTSMPYLIAAGALLVLGVGALALTRIRARERAKVTADGSL